MANNLHISYTDFLNENRLGKDEYKNCLISDIYRMEIVENFFNKIKIDPNYNIENPNLFKLIDDWDGYEEQVYIQNKLTDDIFIFFEGWVNDCWKSAYMKPEYEKLSKIEIIEKIIKDRFPKIGEEFGYYIEKYEYFKYNNKYIMKIIFKKQ